MYVENKCVNDWIKTLQIDKFYFFEMSEKFEKQEFQSLFW